MGSPSLLWAASQLLFDCWGLSIGRSQETGSYRGDCHFQIRNHLSYFLPLHVSSGNFETSTALKASFSNSHKVFNIFLIVLLYNIANIPVESL